MFLFVGFVLIIFLFIGLPFATRRLFNLANRKIWQVPLLDRLMTFLPVVTLTTAALFLLSVSLHFLKILPLLGLIFAFCEIVALMLLLAGFLSLLITQLFPKEEHPDSPPNPSRRIFLKSSTAILPALAVGGTIRGISGAYQGIRIPKIKLLFNQLPPVLHGFKILHLSDLHLGYYRFLPDLEHLLSRVMTEKVDLVLITGDVADDLKLLSPALKMINQIPSRFPKIMSLGNHEYYRGINTVLRILARSPVRLLVNSGISLPVNGHLVYIGGADDPVTLRYDISGFLQDTTAKAMKRAPKGAFNLLLSHRPRALNVAAQYGVNLILSGHTHGGQIGINGHSVFEGLDSKRYWWGKYRNQNTQMYTSSGIGHWFPFRLGCPPEAPIIELRSDDRILV